VRLLAPLLASALLTASTSTLAAPPMADADPWLSRDKALHFGACAGISGASYGLGSLVSQDIRLRVVFGAGAGIFAGAAKELLDLSGTGDPSWKDFAWDVLGTVVGVGIAVTIDLAVRGIGPVRATAR
jgi:putative lipoprotein